MGKRSLEGIQRTDAFLLDPDCVVLVEDESHPLYDARVKLPVDENLVRNIMVHGVIKPIVVCTGTMPPEVLDGRQRVKAAREANRRLMAEGKEPIRVAAVRRRGEEGDLYGVLVSANAHSQVDSPLELARKANRLAQLGKTDEEICIAFGWKKSTLAAHLALLDATPPVRKAVENGQLSVTAAKELGSVPAGEQPKALARLLAEGKPTVQRAKEATGKSRAPRAPGKVRARQVAKELTDSGQKNAAWFVRGVDWVLGNLSDAEVEEHGLKMPVQK